ncbi:MAG TPA: peptidyl-prolyl cis-trans isomerase, partial [Solirubrobacterales bacterium]|nr:peptidyl-prolyl cis-trans isomerase [Solirubrobacterales bacterium]
MSPSQQGRSKGRPGGKPAAAPAPERSAGRRRLGLIAFGILLIALFTGVALAQGVGQPEVSDGEIAVVEESPDGTITTEDFERAIAQTAARQQLDPVPEPGDEQYDVLADTALNDLILAAWVRGEAEERGIEITEPAIDRELETITEQQFGSQKAFDRFLEDANFTLEEARERIELQLISDQIQQDVIPEEPEVNDEEVETYYDENQAQFEQPETRDVRQIKTKTEAEAQDALGQLEQDDSPKSWERVAKEFSIDEATKPAGGLSQAVVEGQNEPALDEQIFSAPEGELVGPFETDTGWYAIQVESISPAQTQPLDCPPDDEDCTPASDTIRQTLLAARQQQLASAFQQDFTAKWRARTVCAEDRLVERCSNAEAPDDPCTEEVAEETGCGAPVPSTKPILPGTAGVFGAPAPAGLPQGPCA